MVLSFSGCWSWVGRTGNYQVLSLSGGCADSLGVIMHEMLHALGFLHEQDRSDRDKYLRILGKELDDGPSRTYDLTPYDLQSEMHYGLNSMRQVRDQNLKFLVNVGRKVFHFYDVMDVNYAYNCADHCANKTVCQNGGFMLKECTCYCPYRLLGDRCEIVDTDGDCGGIYDVDIGQEHTMTSLNYPNSYPINRTCAWLFKGKPGYRLQITFDEMDLPSNDLTTCYHSIAIRYNLIGQIGVSRCGNDTGFSFVTSKDSPELLFVEFDSHINPTRKPGKGFSFRVQLTGKNCLPDTCKFGKCTEEKDGYRCSCDAGFSGTNCDKLEDETMTLECKFDKERSCMFENTDEDDGINWYLQKYKGAYSDTGPHNAYSGRGCLVADMHDKNVKGDKGRLVSTINLPDIEYCLSFYYNMRGESMGSLRVKVLNDAGTQELWTVSGEKGIAWLYGQVNIPTMSDRKIIFEAERGVNYTSMIGLDEIKLAPGVCGKVPDEIYIQNFGPPLYLNEYGMDIRLLGWINFELHACNNVYIVIRTSADIVGESIEVAIGRYGNKFSQIAKYVNGTEVILRRQWSKTLNCDGFEQFWVGWKDKKMQLGRGLLYGENVILSVNDDNPLDITLVALVARPGRWRFMKGNCFPGMWKCKNSEQCVNPSAVCNYHQDCNDASDEDACEFPPCTEAEFRCGYGKCIPKEKRCNWTPDCEDQTDEKECPTRDCSDGFKQIDYRGPTNTTQWGYTCQRWDSQSPHSHGYGDKYGDQENYCRNAGESSAPWCYTTDPNKRWDTCDISPCTIKECKNTVRGETYKGKINTTISGLTCQRWDSNYPHRHGFGAILADEENYCRNPDGEPGPWCYTTSSRRWELCSIPLCDNIACTDAEFQCSFGKCVPKEKQCDLEYDCPEGSDELGDCPIVECKILPQGYGYRGTMNKTTSGLDCQRWDSQSPHSHQYSSLADQENYCRNPNNDNLPWCYTTSSKRWESCDIPLCT